MSEQLSPEEKRETEALNALRKTLEDIYGDEKKLIVMNKTDGVVSIGFGDRGDLGGWTIPRSKLPINLTDQYSAETWTKSSDFRRALTKRWLEVVSPERADKLLEIDRTHQARLKRLAGGNQGNLPSDVSITPMHSPISEDEPMVIDEETSSLKPARSDPMALKYMEYENAQPAPVNAPSASMLSGDVSSRAVAVVEAVRRGSCQPLEAIRQIDGDEKLLTNADLQWISKHASIPSVASYAAQLLNDRISGNNT